MFHSGTLFWELFKPLSPLSPLMDKQALQVLMSLLPVQILYFFLFSGISFTVQVSLGSSYRFQDPIFVRDVVFSLCAGYLFLILGFGEPVHFRMLEL